MSEREAQWADALRIPTRDLMASGAPKYMQQLVERAIARADIERALAWEKGFAAGKNHRMTEEMVNLDYPPEIHVIPEPPANPYLPKRPTP